MMSRRSAPPPARRPPARTGRRRHASRHLRRLSSGLIFVAFVAGTVGSADLARRSSLLAIDTITVDGAGWMSRGELLGLLEPLRGNNLIQADLGTAHASLLASGWIRNAMLRRVFPSTVEVIVEERTPFALGRFGDRLYIIDTEGRVIDEYSPRFALLNLPLVDGLGEDEAPATAAVLRGGRAALAARVIRAIAEDPALSARVSQIDVADPYDVVVLLSGDPARIHLGHEQFAERLRMYLELATTLRSRVAVIDAVDMRFGPQVYVRPAGASEGAERAKGGP